MRINNLIFDLDGTLIDSSEGVVEAVNYSLRQMGEPEQSPQNIKAFIGYSLSQMYPTFTDAPVKELYSHFQKKAAETVVSSTVLLPGADETLRRLKADGYRLAIASTKIRRHIGGIINKFDWHDLITTFAGGDEVAHVKPDPEIFLLTMSRMSADVSETLVVGDTINDVQAARAVPMTVVAVDSPYGGTDKLLKAQPDYFVKSIDDIVGLIDKIQKEAS